MMTSSNGNIFLITGYLCGEFTDNRWIPCTKAWIYGWVNNGKAGDLRRHRAHYDVIVMNNAYEHEFEEYSNPYLNIINHSRVSHV